VRCNSFILFCLLAVAPVSNAAEPVAVDCTHLVAWAAGGAPTSKLIGILRSRGAAVTPKAESDLRRAGVAAEVISTLTKFSNSRTSTCPGSLITASALAHDKKYEEAADLVSNQVQKDPHNGALHFLLAYLKQQQGDWNSAFDEYSTSKEAEPDFAEVHNRLALVFYQGDDGENAIGEARTALSMDFNDAEAYRMLALGHYSNQQYVAAERFQESLARDPDNADIYYEMGWRRDQQSNAMVISENHCHRPLLAGQQPGRSAG
jgi:tetratricopeptide (TPR) repeat protein